MFPPIFSQHRGEAQSRGEREIRDELSFQASDKLRDKKTGSESPESLASRIIGPLTEWPGAENERGNIKMLWSCPKFVKYLYAPKNRCFQLVPERNGFW